MNDLASNVIEMFGVIYRSLVRDEMDQVEIGPDSRSAVLSVLVRTGRSTMTDLSRALRVSKSNITFLVDRLEELGLLTRKADPADRRKVWIELTDKGLAEIRQKRASVLARIEDKLARLDPDERAYIEEALPRIIRILSKLYSAEA